MKSGEHMRAWFQLCGALRSALLIGGAVGAFAAGAQTETPAQTPASGGLEEIVVTSQRRAERLQDVPISVSAFTQEKMDAQGIRNVDSLATLTPGVTFERMGLSAASNYNDENSDISIRGIDSSAGPSTTAIYIDDTPIQTRHIGFGTVNAFPLLFDLERVEVLRGPQGTLFGASAEGGAVRFVTPDPSLTAFSGYERTELASTDGGAPSYEAGVAAGGPIVDGTLGFRVSAYYRLDGGYVDRADYRTGQVTEPDANWQQTSVIRAALKWAVTDAVSVTPSIFYQRLHINDTGAYWPSLSNAQDGVFLNGNAQRNPSTDPFYLAAVKLDAEVSSSVHLTANASYFSRDQYDTPDYTQFDRADFGLDPRAPYGHFGESPFTDVQHNTILEARLQSTDPGARLTWTAGVYAAHLDENSTQFIYDPTLNAEYTAAYGTPLCTALAPCPDGQIFAGPEDRVIDKQAAVFGEVTLRMTDAWLATVGLRVAHLEIDGTSISFGPFDGPTVGAANPEIATGTSTENPVTPRVVLSYKPNGQNLLYASAAKGYRGGGINGVLPNTCGSSLQTLGLTAAPTAFGEDSLWSYEVGSKNTLFERRLQVDASAFVIDWKGIQQNVYLLSCGVQYTANLGVARSQGGDVHVEVKPLDKLLFDLTAAYTDAKYTHTICAGSLACTGAGALSEPLVTEGDRLPGAPWSFTFSTEFGLPSFHERDPYVRFDYHYTTAQQGLLPGQDPNNGIADPTIPGLPRTSTLAMRAGLRWSGIDLSLFGQNLTNEHPLLFESRDITNENLYFARSTRPRTVGVTASYRY
jgi:iron complex outermembrane receptor protein